MSHLKKRYPISFVMVNQNLRSWSFVRLWSVLSGSPLNGARYIYSKTRNHTPSGPKVHNGDYRKVIKLEFSDLNLKLMHVCQTRLYFILLWHIKGALHFLILGILRNIDEHLIISSIALLSVLPSQCSGPCNLTSSVQTRQAQCVNSESVAVEPSACDKSSQPELSRKCQDCSYWVEELWSRVSENHRGNIKYLIPLCINYLSIEYLYGENYCILHDAVLMRVI